MEYPFESGADAGARGRDRWAARSGRSGGVDRRIGRHDGAVVRAGGLITRVLAAVGPVVAGLVASVSLASAQDAAPSGGQMPTLSASCEAPANDIAMSAPLPHVAKVLTEHRAIQILAVGSASMNGVGVGVKSYPMQIERLLKVALNGVDVEIVNRGTGGEVAQTTADRIRSEVALTKPDLVLWQLGTNDALARVDPDHFTAIVTSTIDWLRANDIDVVLVGLQYTSRFSRDQSYFAIKRALDKIAKDEGILYVRRYEAMKFISQTRSEANLMTSDNYHLSDLGLQCQAEHVAGAMIASLFVRRFRPVPTDPDHHEPARSN